MAGEQWSFHLIITATAFSINRRSSHVTNTWPTSTINSSQHYEIRTVFQIFKSIIHLHLRIDCTCGGAICLDIDCSLHLFCMDVWERTVSYLRYDLTWAYGGVSLLSARQQRHMYPGYLYCVVSQPRGLAIADKPSDAFWRFLYKHAATTSHS